MLSEDTDLGMFAKWDTGEKPRYRIQWDFENGVLVGYYVKTQNFSAIILKPNFYISLV